MNNTIQPGDTIDLTAPAGGVVSGQGFIIGKFFCVSGNGPDALGPIVAGQKFPAVLVNVVSLTKTAAEVWAEGDDIHWRNTAKEASNVSGDMKIGAASAAAAGPDATGNVRLDGISAAEPASASIFVSTEQTGTGAPQNIAHGLGVIPSQVFASPTDLAPATVGEYTVTEGAHDATDVIVTVTTGKKFKVMALI